MKSKFLYSLLFIGTGLLAFVSCKKKVEEITTRQYNFNKSSMVQVYVGTVSATRNYVYVDNTPVTGAAVVLGGLFPSTGYSAVVSSGQRTLIIKDTLATSTQAPLTFTQTFNEKKNYTIFTYDTITSPKMLVTESSYSLKYENSAQLRFANLIYSKTAVPNVDIFSKRLNANIFSNVPVAGIADFITMPTIGLSDTLLVRQTGTQTQLAALNSVVLQASRYYTIVFRGSYAVSTGTGANLRTLSLFTNY
jgi:hypothetical protein